MSELSKGVGKKMVMNSVLPSMAHMEKPCISCSNTEELISDRESITGKLGTQHIHREMDLLILHLQ